MKHFTGALRVLKPLDGYQCSGDSLTVQSQAKDSDINVIMDRYLKTGQLPPVSRVPTYGDFDGISDYREAMEVVRAAQEQFMALPAKVRARFENDPHQFIEFCSDARNVAELSELGLLSTEAKVAYEKSREVKAKPTDGSSGKGDTTPAARRKPGRDDSASGAEGAG